MCAALNVLAERGRSIRCFCRQDAERQPCATLYFRRCAGADLPRAAARTEGWQLENMKLKEALEENRIRIQNLESSVATAVSAKNSALQKSDS
eukprot:768759-Hanusia_phi.AAC.23